MNKLILTAVLVLFAGCDDTQQSQERKASGYGFSVKCMQGKEFIVYFADHGRNGYYGLTINLDMDGKPIPCQVQKQNSL